MANAVSINEKEFREAIDSFDEMRESIDDSRWMKSMLRRRSNKHFIGEMKRNSPSGQVGSEHDQDRLAKMIGVTTARKWAPNWGVRIGVVKNDPNLFPDVSAQGLASMLEHGTKERYRRLVSAGIVTGRVSLGRIDDSHAWLRAAYDRNVDGFMRDVEKSLTKKVMKEA